MRVVMLHLNCVYFDHCCCIADWWHPSSAEVPFEQGSSSWGLLNCHWSVSACTFICQKSYDTSFETSDAMAKVLMTPVILTVAA